MSNPFHRNLMGTVGPTNPRTISQDYLPMPIDKQSLTRLVRATADRNIVQDVIPQSISPKEKKELLSEFQKQAVKLMNTNEVVLMAVKVT